MLVLRGQVYVMVGQKQNKQADKVSEVTIFSVPLKAVIPKLARTFVKPAGKRPRKIAGIRETNS